MRRAPPLPLHPAPANRRGVAERPLRAPGRRPARPELDRETLALAQRGDRAAQRALIERYRRPVSAIVARTLGGQGDRALVEDLTQDTFLRVLQALTSFDLERSTRPSSWILTIARRRAIDELRRRRRVIVDFDDDRTADAGASTDRLAERRRLAARLDAALAELAPDFRAVFLLREAEELSYDEIAARLGVRKGTVKSRLSRARSAMREHLAAA
ncbi:MAG: sigma-70 family RNA polymerase sigma factor [Nannocystaceae bacterium]